VELEVEEDLFAAGHQIADERRANGGEELLADLIKADAFAKLEHQRPGFLFAGNVERHD
jgi:hypothetical protein